MKTEQLPNSVIFKILAIRTIRIGKSLYQFWHEVGEANGILPYVSQVSTQFLVPKVWNQIRLRWLRGPSSPTIQGSGKLATRTRSLTPLQSKINGSRPPYPISYSYFTHYLNMFLHFQKEPPREHRGPTYYAMTGQHHFLISTSFLNFLYPLHHLLYFSALLNLITLPFHIKFKKKYSNIIFHDVVIKCGW